MKKSGNGLDGLLKNKGLKKTAMGDDPETIELMKSMAKMTRAKYKALIKEGFNEDQALELCKNLLSLNYDSKAV